MAQAIGTLGRPKEGAVARSLDRSLLDRLISWSGAIVALALVALGVVAIFGGLFALDSVRARLEPQKIRFPAASEMSAQEKAEVGEFAGQTVDTGTEAEAYARYIGVHLKEIGGGKTYAELGAVQFALQDKVEAARASGDPGLPKLEEELAALTAQRDTMFKGETLRAILLNAYGWWTVGQIVFYAGVGMVIAGVVLAVLVVLGFRHARKVAAAAA